MKIEKERFSIPCSRCRQNLKFGNFTSSLCRVIIIQEATSSLYSGLQKYSEWCMVNLALKKRTERSLSFSHRPYIAILMLFDCVCSEYPDPDYLHYRW